jgi:LPXTG-motif cell wall-anchored protein
MYKNVVVAADGSWTGTKVNFRDRGIIGGKATYMVNDTKLDMPLTNLNANPLATEQDKPAGPNTTILISPASGGIHIYGLDHGIYYLVEIESPAGFHKLEAPIIVNVERIMNPDWTDDYDKFLGDYKVTWTYQPHGRSEVENLGNTVTCIDVLNLTGPRLPGTGGIGTTIVVIAGLLIIALLGTALFIYKKRSTLSTIRNKK